MLFNIYQSFESVFRLTVWLHKDPGTHVFELGLNDFGLRLMIFHIPGLTITICHKIIGTVTSTKALIVLKMGKSYT